jgi:uncharacterized membrane protein YeaQ/YmgE (transglycosylase-associated protein family)
MSGPLINLIIQLVAGAIGGNAAGNALKDYDLGMLGNSISGAVGGLRVARFCNRSSLCSQARQAAWISAHCSGRP